MSATLVRADLLSAAKRAATSIENTPCLPILSSLRLQISGGRCTLTGSDMETEVSASFECDADDFATAVPARKLIQILGGLATAEVKLSLGESRATLTAGAARYQLATLDADAYPQLDATGGSGGTDRVTVDALALARLIDQTAYACGHNDVRHYLNGLHLDGRRGAKFVATATDGHRLARAELPLPDGTAIDRDLILSVSAITAVRKLLPISGPLDLQFWDRGIRLDAPGIAIATNLIDWRYPDSDRVIPRNNPGTCTVDRMLLESAIKRTVVLANEQYRGVRLTFDRDSIALTAHNEQQEEAEDRIAADYTGDPLVIGFNAHYLLGALAAINADSVRWELPDNNGGSSLISANNDTDDSIHVLMPMRL